MVPSTGGQMPGTTDLETVARYREALASDQPDAALAADVDALFQRHSGRVYEACRQFVGDPNLAADLAQQTMLVAWKKLGDFRGESAFSTWLYSIARYLCFNAMRKKTDVLVEDGVFEAADPASSALRSLRRLERERLLSEVAAAVLDPLEQEAVYLRYVETIPQDRITELLDIDSKSGARGVLQRCRRKLRRELLRRLHAMGHGSSFFWDTHG